MSRREGKSSSISEHAATINLRLVDGWLGPVQGTIPKGSISKHLVSHNLTPPEKAQCIQRLLASKEEQRETMNLEPGDALRLVELLDEVCFLPLNHSTTSDVK